MRAEIRNEVTRFITTMLHEASHLVNLSKDIKYSKTAIKDWDINFQPCTQLTTEDNLFISAEHFQHDSRLSTPPPD